MAYAVLRFANSADELHVIARAVHVLTAEASDGALDPRLRIISSCSATSG
jgi:hypothetical protein